MPNANMKNVMNATNTSIVMYVSACNDTPYLYINSIVIGTIMYSANTAPMKNNKDAGTSRFLSNLISFLYNPGFINPVNSHNIKGIDMITPHIKETYICADNACPGPVKITLTYSGSTISCNAVIICEAKLL